MTMRQKSIETLLREINENIEFIQSNYRKATSNELLQGKLQVKVKSSLEHLRSCLDYIAHDIYEIIIFPITNITKDKIYFPYGETQQNFYSAVSNNISKNLQAHNKDIYNLLESIQPYLSNNNWLIDLCKNTNFQKHNDMSDHKIMNVTSIMEDNIERVHIENSNVRLNGCIVAGKRIYLETRVDGTVITNTEFGDSNPRLINWSSFTFKTNNIDILKLLYDSFKDINSLQSKIYSILKRTT